MATSKRQCAVVWDNAHENPDDHLGRHACGAEAGHAGPHWCWLCDPARERRERAARKGR